jgi:hypothetical protein
MAKTFQSVMPPLENADRQANHAKAVPSNPTIPLRPHSFMPIGIVELMPSAKLI